MKKPISTRMPHDHPEMTAAVDWLEAQGHRFHRTTQFQLKIACMNFYPNTGRIYLDSGKTLKERGLPVLEMILARPHQSLKEATATCVELGLLEDDGPLRAYL